MAHRESTALLERSTGGSDAAESLPAVAAAVPADRRGGGSDAAGLKTLVSLGDQAVVSATSFATTIALGRWCAAEQLGLYCLGFSLAVMLLTALQSLVTVPYTVYSQRLEGTAHRQYAGGVLLQAVALGLLGGVALVAWSAGRYALWGPQPLSWVLAALASVLVWVVLREFARRYCMAQLNVRAALAVDVGMAAVHLGCLGWLAWSGRLTAVTALLSLGGACGVVVAAWLLLSRRQFAFGRQRFWPSVRQNWRMGRWVFAGQMVGNMISDVLIVWLVAVSLGAAQAGVFAAAVSVVNVSNPFLLGMTQILGPRIARAFGRQSRPRFRQVVLRSAVMLGAAMGGFWLLVAAGGPSAMDLIYRGKYPGCGLLMSLLAAAAWVHAAWICPGMGLCALDRAEINFRAAVAGLVVTALTTALLVRPWGLEGVAAGMLAGQVIVAVITWWNFLRRSAGGDREGTEP